jgi:hypothetical protein
MISLLSIDTFSHHNISFSIPTPVSFLSFPELRQANTSYINEEVVWTNYTNAGDFVQYDLSGNTPDVLQKDGNELYLFDQELSGTVQFTLIRELEYTCPLNSMYYNYTINAYIKRYAIHGGSGYTRLRIRYYYEDDTYTQIYDFTPPYSIGYNINLVGGFTINKKINRIQLDIWNVKGTEGCEVTFRLYDENYKEDNTYINFTKWENASTNMTYQPYDTKKWEYYQTGNFTDWGYSGTLDAYSDMGNYLYAYLVTGDGQSQSAILTRDLTTTVGQYVAANEVYRLRLYYYVWHNDIWGGSASISIKLVYNDSSEVTISSASFGGGGNQHTSRNETYEARHKVGVTLDSIKVSMSTNTPLWGLSYITFYLYDERYRYDLPNELNLTNTNGYWESLAIDYEQPSLFMNYTQKNYTYDGTQDVRMSFAFRNESEAWSDFTQYPSGEINVTGRYMKFRVNMTANPYNSDHPSTFYLFDIQFRLPNASSIINILEVSQSPTTNISYLDSVNVSAIVQAYAIPSTILNYTINNWTSYNIVNMTYISTVSTNHTFNGTIPKIDLANTTIRYVVFSTVWNGTVFINTTSIEYNYTTEVIPCPRTLFFDKDAFIEHSNTTNNVTIGNLGIQYTYSWGAQNFLGWKNTSGFTHTWNVFYFEAEQDAPIYSYESITYEGYAYRNLTMLSNISTDYLSYSIPFSGFQGNIDGVSSIEMNITVFFLFNDSSIFRAKTWYRNTVGYNYISETINGSLPTGKFLNSIVIYSYMTGTGGGGYTYLYNEYYIGSETYIDNRTDTGIRPARDSVDTFYSNGYYLSNDVPLGGHRIISNITEQYIGNPIIRYWDNNTQSWITAFQFIGTNQSFFRLLVNFSNEPTQYLESFLFNITLTDCGIYPLLPPTIINVIQSPLNGSIDITDTVNITTYILSVYPNVTIYNLTYSIDNWASNTSINMTLKSQNYNIYCYNATIPTYPFMTTVKYVLFFSVSNGTHSANTTSGVYEYIVGDFIPPDINHNNGTISTINGLSPQYSPFPNLITLYFYANITDKTMITHVSFNLNFNGTWITNLTVTNVSSIYQYTFSNFRIITGNISLSHNGYLYYYWNATDLYNNTKIANYTIQLDNSPPVVSNVHTVPATPVPGTGTWIYCNATDKNGISIIQLKYSINSWGTNYTIAMSNIGGTGYRAFIPAQSFGATVDYEIYVSDGFNGWTSAGVYFPPNENRTYGQYILSDPYAPKISFPIIYPNPYTTGIGPEDYLYIAVIVTDAESGVSTVQLRWKNVLLGIQGTIAMTKDRDMYTAIVPPQLLEGSFVTIVIEAVDNQGNTATLGPIPYQIVFTQAAWRYDALIAWFVIIGGLGALIVATWIKPLSEMLDPKSPGKERGVTGRLIMTLVSLGAMMMFIIISFAQGFLPVTVNLEKFIQQAGSDPVTWIVLAALIGIGGVGISYFIYKKILPSETKRVKVPKKTGIRI